MLSTLLTRCQDSSIKSDGSNVQLMELMTLISDTSFKSLQIEEDSLKAVLTPFRTQLFTSVNGKGKVLISINIYTFNICINLSPKM